MQIRSEDLSVGNGACASFWQTLRFHYTIRDTDGLIADQTEEQPFVFELLPDHTGWLRHLAGMRVGGRRRLFVPADHVRLYDRDLVIDIHLVAVDDEPIISQTRDALLGDGPEAQWGDTAYIHYVKAPLPDYTRNPPPQGLRAGGLSARLLDGATESTREGPPVHRVLGAGDPLDEAIVGMRPGGMRHVRRAPVPGDAQPRFVWVRLVALQQATPAEA